MKKNILYILVAAIIFSGCTQISNSSLELPKDSTPPAAVTELKAESKFGKVIVTWKDPADSDFYGAKVYTGTVVNGEITYGNAVIVTYGVQKYESANLENGKKYIFKVISIDESLNQSDSVQTDEITYTDKILNIAAGIYKVQHLLQNLNDLQNYTLTEVEENKALEANCSLAAVQKEFSGFETENYAYSEDTVYVYYNRKEISYTFIEGESRKTVKGLYGSAVPRILKPKKETVENYNFLTWKSNVNGGHANGEAVTKTFGAESLTFEPYWLDIDFWIKNEAKRSKTDDVLFDGDNYVLLNSDVVTTSTGSAEINDFLIGNSELTYSQWEKVSAKANEYGYTFAVGGYIKRSVVITDSYDGNKEYKNPESDEYKCDRKTPDGKDIYINLATKERYSYDENGKKLPVYETKGFIISKDEETNTATVPCYWDRDTENFQLDTLDSYKLYTGTVSGYQYYIKNGVSDGSISKFEYDGYEKIISEDNDVLYIKNYNFVCNGIYGIRLNPETNDFNFLINGIWYDIVLLDGYIFVYDDNTQKICKDKKDIKKCCTDDYSIYTESDGRNYIFYPDSSEKRYVELFNGNYLRVKLSNDGDTITKYLYFRTGNNKSNLNYEYKSGLADYSNRPLSGIIYSDAIVWCNLASEIEGLTPVYYVEGSTDFTSENVLRKADRYTIEDQPNPKIQVYIRTPSQKAVVNPAANGYRLPTDAEWEYAARGGDPLSSAWNYAYAGGNEISELGWFYDNSKLMAHKVKTKSPNSIGIYDMSGNLEEYVYINLPTENRSSVIRGGGFFCGSNDCVITRRCFIDDAAKIKWLEKDWGDPECVLIEQGFRIVRSLK